MYDFFGMRNSVWDHVLWRSDEVTSIKENKWNGMRKVYLNCLLYKSCAFKEKSAILTSSLLCVGYKISCTLLGLQTHKVYWSRWWESKEVLMVGLGVEPII